MDKSMVFLFVGAALFFVGAKSHLYELEEKGNSPIGRFNMYDASFNQRSVPLNSYQDKAIIRKDDKKKVDPAEMKPRKEHLKEQVQMIRKELSSSKESMKDSKDSSLKEASLKDDTQKELHGQVQKDKEPMNQDKMISPDKMLKKPDQKDSVLKDSQKDLTKDLSMKDSVAQKELAAQKEVLAQKEVINQKDGQKSDLQKNDAKPNDLWWTLPIPPMLLDMQAPEKTPEKPKPAICPIKMADPQNQVAAAPAPAASGSGGPCATTTSCKTTTSSCVSSTSTTTTSKCPTSTTCGTSGKAGPPGGAAPDSKPKGLTSNNKDPSQMIASRPNQKNLGRKDSPNSRARSFAGKINSFDANFASEDKYKMLRGKLNRRDDYIDAYLEKMPSNLHGHAEKQVSINIID